MLISASEDEEGQLGIVLWVAAESHETMSPYTWHVAFGFEEQAVRESPPDLGSVESGLDQGHNLIPPGNTRAASTPCEAPLWTLGRRRRKNLHPFRGSRGHSCSRC